MTTITDHDVMTQTEMRAALDDLTGRPARRLAGVLVVGDLVLIATLAIIHRRIDGRELLTIGVGGLLLGALALLSTIAFGDLARAAWLSFSGPGSANLDRQRHALRLLLRAQMLCGVVVGLGLVGLLLVFAMCSLRALG